jgi:DNA (cytosine-5)-methyltransferase 1
MDLFCGAGGFSEGFKEMGFDIVYSLDNWRSAVDTIKQNHPDTEVVKADVTETDASDLPHADVIIGGPPCTEFSYSKKGGGGNIKEGMKLVLRFLYFIQELRPRWWIMENVPRLLNTLPLEVSLRKLGIDKDGRLKIPRRMVLNSADFGAPQKRLRLIS